MMVKGAMLVCEGGNGAGKTTVLKAIEAHLVRKGRDVVMTREPGGTPIGERIRAMILSNDSSEMSDVTELLLFAAARAQHVSEKILPAIQAGKVVVSDRFDASTVSFQHFGRGLSLDTIQQLNKIALGGFSADMTIILDIDPAIGLSRVLSRGDGLDRMERERIDFLSRAREGYLAQAKDCPDRFAVVDASLPLESVLDSVIRVVDRFA